MGPPCVLVGLLARGVFRGSSTKIVEGGLQLARKKVCGHGVDFLAAVVMAWRPRRRVMSFQRADMITMPLSVAKASGLSNLVSP